MNRCLITNIQTNNKWKNQPICKEMVLVARQRLRDPANSHLSMTDMFNLLQKEWRRELAKNK